MRSTSTNRTCPHCKGTGNEPGTEVWGKEPADGGYTMEIMCADDCYECGGTGDVPGDAPKRVISVVACDVTGTVWRGPVIDESLPWDDPKQTKGEGK